MANAGPRQGTDRARRREYPISTLLVWRTTSGIKRRKFIDNWKDSLRLSDFDVPSDKQKKGLVLDGQQRLQSLFISLKGSFEGKELYFDLLSGDLAAPDDIKYRLRFLTNAQAAFPWVRLKDLVFTNEKKREVLAKIAAAAGRQLSQAELNKVEDHFDLVTRTMRIDEVLTYQELDSIDRPDLYTEDDVVEVFIRANAGGTKLGKSDLLFSLLAAGWDDANEQIEDLLERLNRTGFQFDRDFLLKTALTVLGHGARYEVEKFRKPGVRDEVEAKWLEISSSVAEVLDFVRSKTLIRTDKGLPTYLVLIPLIYLRYRFPDAWKTAVGRDTYLLRSALAGAFSGSPDNLLDARSKRIEETKGFDLEQMFEVIRSQGRSLELTEERFWHLGYGSDTVHLLFNLWYPRFNYEPAFDGNMPQVDHVFPKSLLKTVKALNEQTGRYDIMRYRDAERNQLANCMLLTAKENGPQGKGAKPPDRWFADKNEEYLDLHLIPKDPALWKLERFEDFIEARKELIRAKLSDLLVAGSAHPVAPASRSEAAVKASATRRATGQADERPEISVEVATGLLDRFVQAAGDERRRAEELLDEFVRRSQEESRDESKCGRGVIHPALGGCCQLRERVPRARGTWDRAHRARSGANGCSVVIRARIRAGLRQEVR